MNGFSSVIKKEFMHLRRDPATLVIALLLPLIQMIFFGYAINFDVRHIPTTVLNMDNSRESREYLAKVQASQYLKFVSVSKSPDEAIEALKSGAAKVAVTIPPDFARIMAAGKNPQVGVQIDGSDVQVSQRAQLAFMAPPPGLAKGAPDVRMSILFNPDGRTANFMIPGLLAVILQIVTVALTAFSIVREKEQGTLEQLMVTPVSRLGLMLGKLVPYAVLGLVELLVALIISNFAFGVESRGSLIALVFMSLPFLMASLALGLLISTVAKTQGQALQFTMLSVMPAILLSGYISPRETMPGWLYLISNILPTTHYIQVTRGIMIRGADVWSLLPQFFILSGIATLLILASTTRFRKSIA